MQTFTQFEVTLAPMGTLTGWLGHLLHGALFEQLKAASPALAQRIHSYKRKPFSLHYQLREGLITLCIGVWDEELALAIPAAFVVGGTLTLSRTTAKIRAVALTNERTLPCKEALQAAFRLDFRSPTCFSSSGNIVLFPGSRHVIESLYHAVSFTGKLLPPLKSCEAIAAFVHPCGYDLRTQVISFGGYTHSGFIGHCDYIVSKELPQKQRALLCDLLSAIPYTGIGYKTAMGMGTAKFAQK